MKSLPADFSASDYLRLNPDVALAGANPAQHYLEFGHAEGRVYTIASIDKEDLLSTGLFDPDFYVQYYPDILESGVDPADHFLASGCAEGRWPSLFFRSDWYMDRYPASRSHAKNCLFHYIEIGSKLGYEPNPFFEPDYYVEKYRHKLEGREPLTHFIKYGEEGFNPSPRFDSKSYLKETGCSGNPLKHYLEIGMGAGVVLRRAEPLKWGEYVESAFLTILKGSAPVERVALLITHSSDGEIKPHVEHYATELAKGGLSIFLIVASDFSNVSIPEKLKNGCSNIVVRQNIGYDFAAWAHILKSFPWLMDCVEIILTNDSIIGPIGKTGTALMAEVRSHSEDLVGLIENHEHADHLQSFFLMFGEKAIRSNAFKEFWSAVVNHNDKSRVIRDYEVTLTSRMKAAGLTTSCVFQKAGANNATIFKWQELLDCGFPFLKFEVVKNSGSKELKSIGSKLNKMSYDISLIPQLK
ncbi:Rhamnan synthesis protein F [Pseudomonas congelans]|uniref:Rhamnan synthesis protein F n=1 Tax=Pseudomonas congelans TaxID=200452 RepID=A0A1H0PUZ6_9PSED|nr:rhamnan synthesis F family protein [Pseudomonas congelans]SDP08376.1 Rhamnan synthesis protein F [Pseudomonas congelans]